METRLPAVCLTCACVVCKQWAVACVETARHMAFPMCVFRMMLGYVPAHHNKQAQCLEHWMQLAQNQRSEPAMYNVRKTARALILILFGNALLEVGGLSGTQPKQYHCRPSTQCVLFWLINSLTDDCFNTDRTVWKQEMSASAERLTVSVSRWLGQCSWPHRLDGSRSGCFMFVPCLILSCSQATA